MVPIRLLGIGLGSGLVDNADHVVLARDDHGANERNGQRKASDLQTTNAIATNKTALMIDGSQRSRTPVM